jgi:hypothetical protein
MSGARDKFHAKGSNKMDKISYEVNTELIDVTEVKNENDYEFVIRIKTNEALNRLRKLRVFFESDKVYTDIMFYSRKDREFQVIVRRDAYVPFIAHLFQLQLLIAVRWIAH